MTISSKCFPKATGHSKDQLQINLTENGIKSLFFQAWIMATELLLRPVDEVWLVGADLRSAWPHLQSSPLLHES